MINKRIFAVALAALTFSVVSVGSRAMPFQNGDFSSGLDSWENAGAGDASVVSGVAVLETLPGDGANPFSAILVQGDDGFFSFASAFDLPSDTATLQFDVRTETTADPGEAGGSIFSDALTVVLYDALGSGPTDLLFTSGTDYPVTIDWQTVSLDVASLAGRSVALAFEVFDESDGADTRFFLDNIALVPRVVGTVPLASTGFLLVPGLMLLGRRVRKHAVK